MTALRPLDIAGLNVSRETLERLDHFTAQIIRWTARINLISSKTIPDLWDRHIRDSAQLVPLIEKVPTHWVDLGSGGGLPGLVVAIIADEIWPECRVTLVESDQRKATFLRSMIRETGIRARVLAERVEDIPPQAADVVSARALAPLSDLLGHAARHILPTGIALLPKGRSAAAEIDQARQHWRFALAIQPSLTDHEAGILRIERIERV